MKKLLAVLIGFIVCVGMCSQLFAAEPVQEVFTDVMGTQHEEAVKTLVDFKILTGFPDGTFKPEASVTRAEFAAIMTRALSLQKVVEATEETIIFSDVTKDHWALKNINVAFDEKLINGFPDGTFKPDDPVTYEQAVKIIVQALKYEEQAIKGGGYPWGYLVTAESLGVTKQLKEEMGKSLNRGSVAKLLFSAINIPVGGGSTSLAAAFGKITHYVSPEGNDENPGTLDKPWKTFKKAAMTAQVGDTVVFEDGEYYETSVTSFRNSGEEGRPITYKARNKRGATIVYAESTRRKGKLRIEHRNFINIEDFVIKVATDIPLIEEIPYDGILCTAGAQNINIIGNKVIGGFKYEVGIYTFATGSVTPSRNILIEGNTVIGVDTGIDSLSTSDVIIRNNEIIECNYVGIMVKGSSRNTLIYNNYIHNETVQMTGYAITIGGVSNNIVPIDTAAGTGFESHHGVFYNNIIHSKVSELINAGFAFIGSKDSNAYNNVIIGCRNGFMFLENNGLANGWGWDAPNINPVIKNNIFANCTNAYSFSALPQNMMASNNLFFNTPPASEPGGKTGDPLFVDINGDWHLKKGSPAIGAGVPMPTEITGYGGPLASDTVKIDHVDFAGDPRTAPWDIGVYNVK